MKRLAGLRWRKSTHSGSNGGGCIEVADHDDQVLVRDTQDRPRPVLQFGPAAWRRFTSRVKNGSAERPEPRVPRYTETRA
jgi:hypothetical protein